MGFGSYDESEQERQQSNDEDDEAEGVDAHEHEHEGSVTVESDVDGEVSYSFASGDLSQAGIYSADFKVDDNGAIQSVPDDRNLTIEVVAGPGDA